MKNVMPKVTIEEKNKEANVKKAVYVNEFHPVEEIKSKEIGWLRAVMLMLFGIVVTIGIAFGGMKLYERYQKPSETTENAPLSSSPSPVAAESIPYNPVLQESVLSSETYVNEEERFKIRPPKDWTVDTSGKLGAPVFFFNPEFSTEGGIQYKSSISVQTGIANGHILDGYKQFYIQDLKGKLSDLKILEERRLVFSGREAVLIKISFVSSELKMKGELLLMVDQDIAYVATGLDLESYWEKTETSIETSLYTFNLL